MLRPVEAGRRSPVWSKVMAIAMAIAVALAACSGDDADPEGSAPIEDTGTDTAADGGAPDVLETGDAAAATVLVDDVAADGDALLPCVGVGGEGTVDVAYLQIGDPERVGPLADAFRGALADYNERCGGVAGGLLQVSVGFAAGADGCSGPVLDALVVVTDAADDATVDCLSSGDRAVWHEAGVGPDSADGPLAGTDAPPAQRADAAVTAAIAEQVIGDRQVVVVHDGSARAVGAVDDGVLPALDAAGIEPFDTLVAPCSGSPLGRPVGDVFLIALLPAACLADLTAEVDSDVRWLVIEDRLSLAPDPDLTFVPDVFDSALAYEFASTPVQGLPRDRSPVARDRACVRWLDGFTGNETVHPSAAFSAHARLCGTLAGLVASLHAAGNEPQADGVVAAIADIGEVVLAQGQPAVPGSEPWLAPRQVMTLEWNADCGCWTHVGGPETVPAAGG